MRRSPTAWSVAVSSSAESSSLRGTVPVAGRTPVAMRTPQLLLACLVFFACAPTGVDNTDLVEVTVRLKLAGDRDVGATPGRVWVFIDSQPVARALAFPDFGEPCVLATTPVSTCTFSAPRSSYVSLLASEPDPAVVVRFAPKSPQDTVRDGRYVEFTGWTECPDQTERGQCAVRAREATTIEGNFQLMQQVSVYQTRAATMDFVTFAAGADAQGSGRKHQHPRLRRMPSPLRCATRRSVRFDPNDGRDPVSSVHRVCPPANDRGNVPGRWTRDRVPVVGWQLHTERRVLGRRLLGDYARHLWGRDHAHRAL